MYDVKVIADSIGPNGYRLITIEATYPRFIHAEVLTHRDRARNSASNRAIPWVTVCERIMDDPVVPIFWAKEGRGMTTLTELGDDPKDMEMAGKNTGMHFASKKELIRSCEVAWINARDKAAEYAQQLDHLGVHKSICNRLIEPFQWISTVMTATQWNHFLALRNHPDAEKHFQLLASMIEDSIIKSIPRHKLVGEAHLPYVDDDDIDFIINHLVEIKSFLMEDSEFWSIINDAIVINGNFAEEVAKMLSIARCARVSVVPYKDGKLSLKRDAWSDLKTFRRLLLGSTGKKVYDARAGREVLQRLPHISPFEHVAIAMPREHRDMSGPFRGWMQYRKLFENEYDDR